MKLTRGDSKTIRFKRINKETKEVITDIPEQVYFTIKELYVDEKYVVQKTLQNGIVYDEEDNYYYITLNPQDTDNLEFGKYDFDIEIVDDNSNYKHTQTGTIDITKEVTWSENEVE